MIASDKQGVLHNKTVYSEWMFKLNTIIIVMQRI